MKNGLGSTLTRSVLDIESTVDISSSFYIARKSCLWSTLNFFDFSHLRVSFLLAVNLSTCLRFNLGARYIPHDDDHEKI